MANGQQLAQENKQRFDAWVRERYAANDWAAYVRGNKLNRSEIARECGFAKSALQQNPAIKQALADVEANLSRQQILKPQARNPDAGQHGSIAEPVSKREKQRLNQLEQQNQSLRAENATLKDKLRKMNLLDEYLMETGRVPR